MSYVHTDKKYQTSNVVRIKGELRGNLSIRKTARRVSVPQTHYSQYQHVEDSLTFGKKEDQTQIVLRTI